MKETLYMLILRLLPSDAVHFGWYGYETCHWEGYLLFESKYNWLGRQTSASVEAIYPLDD